MANKLLITTIQNNGSFAVSGDITASGTYTIITGGKVQSFAGDVNTLGSFAGTLDTSGPNPVMKYNLQPTAPEYAGDLMDAAADILQKLEAGFAVSAPVISGETPFESSTEVTIAGPDQAAIFYTVDGSTPTADSTAYSGAITLDATTTVKAIAVKDGIVSDVASATFTKEAAPADPPAAGGEGGEE